MNLTGNFFPLGLLWFTDLLMILVAVLVWRNKPWKVLVGDTGLQHRFLAACLALTLIWLINIDLSLGVAIHFLGMTTITLMFGWSLALMAAFVAQLGFVLFGVDQLDSIALNFLLSGALPVLVTWRWHRFIESFHSNNPFIFIMGTGFVGCLLGCLAVSGVGVGLLLLGGQFEFGRETWEYVAFLPLFIIPEAVINGMFISGFSILHPQWVVTFDDERFFKAPPPNEMILDEESLPDSMDLDKHETQSNSEEDVDPDAAYRPPASWKKSDAHKQDKDK
ncbi:energy-coupling factor ABC transporter permease [Marinomonas algicola]|uniref:energy-coupling factor ABC transporter permease n=1 Tax=Marinomonas algicola TaxID=2773454 RepID=UPI00174C4FD7|nr:energy-coupling factor ABC transporter permease [Marinomonas algicola]